MSKEERWKTIKEFPNYKISNFGRIKNNKEKLLKPQKVFWGYLRILLYKNKYVFKQKYVHRLVAISFIFNTYNKPFINHKDGNKLNNYYKNLEWVTASENNKDAYKNNLMNKQGENHPLHRLTEKNILFIRKSNKSLKELAKIFRVKYHTIYDIKNNRKWKYLLGRQ